MMLPTEGTKAEASQGKTVPMGSFERDLLAIPTPIDLTFSCINQPNWGYIHIYLPKLATLVTFISIKIAKNMIH